MHLIFRASFIKSAKKNRGAVRSTSGVVWGHFVGECKLKTTENAVTSEFESV